MSRPRHKYSEPENEILVMLKIFFTKDTKSKKEQQSGGHARLLRGKRGRSPDGFWKFACTVSFVESPTVVHRPNKLLLRLFRSGVIIDLPAGR
jgi:hypothetical protein